MTNAQPGAIQKFRDTTARHGVPMSHVPKRCACGKAMHHDCSQEEPSVRNDSKCRTNCRPDHCKCVNKCTT